MRKEQPNTPSSKTSPQEAAAAIRAGDPAAIERWFVEESPALHAFIYYRVGKDRELSADVVQSTFSEALSRLEEFDPERGGMATWLRLLSRNLIRAAVKDKKRHVPLEAFWDRIDQRLGAIYSQIDAAEFPDEVLERAETRQLANVTFTNLPEAYQEVLNAKYIEEQTIESIARDRETTTDAVKAQLRRARAAFRESFLTLIAAEA